MLAKQPQSNVVTHLQVPEHGDAREAALNCCAGSHATLHLVDLQPVRQAWDAYECCRRGYAVNTLSRLLSCVRELLRSTRED